MTAVLKQLHISQGEDHIVERVRQTLTGFGAVESVHFVNTKPGQDRPIVLATMLTIEQAVEAANSLGVPIFGQKSLIIRLAQDSD